MEVRWDVLWLWIGQSNGRRRVRNDMFLLLRLELIGGVVVVSMICKSILCISCIIRAVNYIVNHHHHALISRLFCHRSSSKFTALACVGFVAL
jgi:hypothetical protein